MGVAQGMCEAVETGLDVARGACAAVETWLGVPRSAQGSGDMAGSLPHDAILALHHHNDIIEINTGLYRPSAVWASSMAWEVTGRTG